MAKFLSKRHLSLDFLGKEWKDCFLVLNALTVKESRELMAKKLSSQSPAEIVTTTLKVLEDHFVKGMAPDEGGKLVTLEKKDLEELPNQVLEKAIYFLAGGSSSVNE